MLRYGTLPVRIGGSFSHLKCRTITQLIHTTIDDVVLHHLVARFGGLCFVNVVWLDPVLSGDKTKLHVRVCQFADTSIECSA